MDTALGADKTEFGIAVSTELFQMLPNVDGLLNKVMEVLWHIGCHAGLFQDSEYFAASHALDLGNAVAISESHTDLRRRCALLGELDNLLDEISG